MDQKLYQNLTTNKLFNLKIGPEEERLLQQLQANLKHQFYPWQKRALENFLLFEKHRQRNEITEPVHLMFNMATGSGKTLVMAALILYYYQKGYQQFIFFVNRNNIVDKTENNFIANQHNKFLFKNPIILNDARVTLTKVENFSSYPVGIEIKFTTIQKLYNDLHKERENQLRFDDFKNKKIVMLADEAHHLNVTTKQQGELIEKPLKANASKAEVELKGWEQTVNNGIKNVNPDNVLLEFTATIPDKAQGKYADKLITEFQLPEFMGTGYTKVVKLIYSSFNKRQRTLLALMMNYQRHRVALANNIANFKSVILFRSKTIDDSQNDYQQFKTLIANLSPADFSFIADIKDKLPHKLTGSQFDGSKIEQILNTWLDQERQANFNNLITYLKNNFKDNNLIITNSKTNKTKKEKTTEEQEKLLNNLEDKDNPIRAIFTVERLTEGWDVLNLFDIVRLYSGQDASKDKRGKAKAGKATIAEKQLIGRGVRYYPFSHPDKLATKRKFDQDLGNDLRSLEELYFHSDNESRYISVLKQELRDSGYLEKSTKQPTTFQLKQSQLYENFYRQASVWINQRIDNPNSKADNLNRIRQDYKDKVVFSYHDALESLTEDQPFTDSKRDIISNRGQSLTISVKDIDRHIFRKAINIKAQAANSLFRFNRLQNELEITSIDDLQKGRVFGNLKMEIKTNQADFATVENDHKLKMSLKVLSLLETIIKTQRKPKKGGQFYKISFTKQFGQPKQKLVEPDKIQEGGLVSSDWYVLDKFAGNRLEERLLNFIAEQIDDLRKGDQYDVYLVRNEEVYKIFNFDDGRGFQPDFLLFLINKQPGGLNYQILIEPKGGQFEENDAWKEKFLNAIHRRYGPGNILRAADERYSLIGLPFFSSDKMTNFNDKWSKRVVDAI